MTFPLERLVQYGASVGLIITDRMRSQFQRYGEFLLQYNKNVNLTSITDPEEVVIKHFIDSLSMLHLHRPSGTLIDVGTGAGFPGVPLMIALPGLNVTLLDSLRKRLDFLTQLAEMIDIQPRLIHKRAEEAGRDSLLRESFDTVTARAVAPLNLLAEYCLPLVRVGGLFTAMKGPSVDAEIAASDKALQALGGRLVKVERISLPDGSMRSIVLIKKISQSSTEFPRPSAKIARFPL